MKYGASETLCQNEESSHHKVFGQRMILNKVASKLRSKRALGRSVRDNDNNDNDDDDDDDDDDEQIMVSQEGPWPFGQTPEVSRTDFTDLPTFRFIFLGSRNFSQILLLFVSNSIMLFILYLYKAGVRIFRT